LLGGEVAFAVVTPELLPKDPVHDIDGCLESRKRSLPPVSAPGSIVNRVSELIHANSARLCEEFAHRLADDDDHAAGWRPAGSGLVGPADKLLIDPLAQIDPMVVFDTTRGPVTIESGAMVTAFSRIQGPCHIGAGAQVLGAKVGGGTTLGPCCRVGGEVHCSILQGFSNKYHDGFLGHSYVGAWVNIGAGTQFSDLRNDYGEITDPQDLPTGCTKLGSLIGDHAKLGIGCLLNSGSVIGAFAQVLPAGRLTPKFVPSFCSTSFERVLERTDLDALLGTAATVMARRGRALSPAHENLYRTVFAATAPERRRALREGERRRLRKAA
jgi:UDP-N-acetylglucosamine diphosphorylase/glucosamine-1-phosphate N-acetyltransferase